VKCEVCHRGLTYHRLARDSALIVYDENGRHAYCGACVAAGNVELSQDVEATVLLGDSPASFHGARLEADK